MRVLVAGIGRIAGQPGAGGAGNAAGDQSYADLLALTSLLTWQRNASWTEAVDARTGLQR